MKMSEKSRQHVDSCRFCWMCHHICPIGNATGHERSTARARALGISLVNRGALELDDITDNIYECAGCGGCVHSCVTGWDPVMFTKEVRQLAALENKLPPYISALVDNCLEAGNAYGMTEVGEELAEAMKAHGKKTDTLLFLGADARFRAAGQGAKSVKVFEKAGVDFTLLADEPASGAQLDYLIGALAETKEQMTACAKVLNTFATVVAADPTDAKMFRQTYAEYGVALECRVVTFTAFVADLLKSGRLEAKQSGMAVVFQDPYQLSRDLSETDEAREIVSTFAVPSEMLLCRDETVWAGNILMSEWMPEVIREVAARRIFNATSIGANAMVTACVSEYTALSSAAPNGFSVISLEELILGGN